PRRRLRTRPTPPSNSSITQGPASKDAGLFSAHSPTAVNVPQARLRDNQYGGTLFRMGEQKVAQTGDPTAAAMAEIRELKATIVALREELERERSTREDAVRRAS